MKCLAELRFSCRYFFSYRCPQQGQSFHGQKLFLFLVVGKRTWEMQSQTCPAIELHSSLQNFRPRGLKGAQPSYLSLHFWAIKEEELQEHLKLPQVSTDHGQTTQFTDFYYNLDITTADYSSTFYCILYLQTELSQRPGKGGDSGAATWTFSFRSRAEKNQNKLYSDHNTQKYFTYLWRVCAAAIPCLNEIKLFL